MYRMSRGIEPIIATVIIIAVTLVIAIAVIGWVMGWWAVLTSGGEQLQILPTSTLKTTGSISLVITNRGSADATITKIEVAGIGSCTSGFSVNNNPVLTAVVPGGAQATVSCLISGGTINAGSTYTVRVYTATGNVYTIVLVASSS